MTNLRVGQGEGLRIGKVAASVSINSCARPTRGGPSVLGFVREKNISDDTK